jgi:hypothetical protein
MPKDTAMSKTLLAALVVLGLTALATPAHAFVAEVATSISAATVQDDAQLADAVYAAIRDVVKQAIAFTPSLVQLQSARLVGDRIYLLLLIADAEGEETLKAFGSAGAAPPD